MKVTSQIRTLRLKLAAVAIGVIFFLDWFAYDYVEQPIGGAWLDSSARYALRSLSLMVYLTALILAIIVGRQLKRDHDARVYAMEPAFMILFLGGFSFIGILMWFE